MKNKNVTLHSETAMKGDSKMNNTKKETIKAKMEKTLDETIGTEATDPQSRGLLVFSSKIQITALILICCILKRLQSAYGTFHALFIAPNKTESNEWMKGIEGCKGDLQAEICAVTSFEELYLFQPDEANVVFTTSYFLRTYPSLFIMYQPSLLITTDGTKLVNETKTGAIMRKLGEVADFRVILNKKEGEESPVELAHQLVFLEPTMFGTSEQEFWNRFYNVDSSGSIKGFKPDKEKELFNCFYKVLIYLDQVSYSSDADDIQAAVGMGEGLPIDAEDHAASENAVELEAAADPEVDAEPGIVVDPEMVTNQEAVDDPEESEISTIKLMHLISALDIPEMAYALLDALSESDRTNLSTREFLVLYLEKMLDLKDNK